jgi:hypothetical protein
MRSLPLDIRVVAVEYIHSFERARPVTPPVSLDEIRVVRDPFPVTRLGDTSFLLVQDLDRLTELTALGITQVPVQICRESDVNVTGNIIGLEKYAPADLDRLAAISSENIVVLDRVHHADAEGTDSDHPAPEFVPAGFHFRSGERRSVLVRLGSDGGFLVGLNELFIDIETRGRYWPLAESHRDPDSLLRDPSVEGTLTLPPLHMSDLRKATQSDQCFPPDLVRVSYANRVISVDFPIAVLTADIPIEEKQTFLEDLIALRRQTCRTALVEGRVLILNR